MMLSGRPADRSHGSKLNIHTCSIREPHDHDDSLFSTIFLRLRTKPKHDSSPFILLMHFSARPIKKYG